MANCRRRKRAGLGASRTRNSLSRLLRLLKDPDGMLVSRLLCYLGVGGVGSEVVVKLAHGEDREVHTREQITRVEKRAERGASRTSSRLQRLVRLLKDPAGMLVSWLLPCSGLGRV